MICAVLIDTTDKYVPTMLDSLSDSEELMNRLTRALYTTHDMLSLLNDTLISAGDSLDAGTKATLQGMEKILDKNLTMIDQHCGGPGSGRQHEEYAR